jgi:hypothetical protein
MKNLRNGKGAQTGEQIALRNGSRSRLPVGDIKGSREAIEEALADAAPLRDADGGLPKHDAVAVEVVAAALARYRYMQEALERLTPFTNGGRLRFTLIRELRRTEKQLMSELHELGLTPRGRAALGFDLARTSSEMQKVAEPNRTPEHLRKMVKVLYDAHMLPRVEDVIDTTATEEEQ